MYSAKQNSLQICYSCCKWFVCTKYFKTGTANYTTNSKCYYLP